MSCLVQLVGDVLFKAAHTEDQVLNKSLCSFYSTTGVTVAEYVNARVLPKAVLGGAHIRGLSSICYVQIFCEEKPEWLEPYQLPLPVDFSEWMTTGEVSIGTTI